MIRQPYWSQNIWVSRLQCSFQTIIENKSSAKNSRLWLLSARPLPLEPFNTLLRSHLYCQIDFKLHFDCCHIQSQWLQFLSSRFALCEGDFSVAICRVPYLEKTKSFSRGVGGYFDCKILSLNWQEYIMSANHFCKLPLLCHLIPDCAIMYLVPCIFRPCSFPR